MWWRDRLQHGCSHGGVLMNLLNVVLEIAVRRLYCLREKHHARFARNSFQIAAGRSKLLFHAKNAVELRHDCAIRDPGMVRNPA